MNFEEITPAEFTKFAKNSPMKSFMQTEEIAKLREKSGWTPYYFAVRDKNTKKLLAATMAVAKPTFLGKSVFYTPGGPLMDYQNEKLVAFFIKHLKSYLKSHNAYVLQIDPYCVLKTRDVNGEPVLKDASPKDPVKTLQNLGFLTFNSSQPKYLFVMDLPKDKTPENLLKTFKQNTRNLVRRCDKLGVTVRELTREELPIFKKITSATSERRHFSDRPLAYYEQMYDLFAEKGEVKYLLAESPEAPLAAAMFILYGSEVIYLFSGSEKEYMHKYNAQYAIQWHIIKYALKHNYKRYNFYGIQSLPDPTSKDYGIYQFKKGFAPESGQILELLGSYELPISPLYYLHKFFQKLKPTR